MNNLQQKASTRRFAVFGECVVRNLFEKRSGEDIISQHAAQIQRSSKTKNLLETIAEHQHK